MVEGIEQGVTAAALVAGLRDGREGFTRHMAKQFLDYQAANHHVPFLHATLPLVAERSRDGVIGSLIAYPPVGVISQFIRQTPAGRRRLEALLSGGTGMARVKSLGVDVGHQKEGIGSALIRACQQIYTYCEYFIIYGQMPCAEGLEAFYRKNGYEVLDPGEGFDAWVVFGSHAFVQAPKDERIFLWMK
ncbi:GNAT family N-acetyltransferase [Micromonospora sp. WMMD718]|uniref:GNAT family N-acetyltransferase n=1 Tax=unclassified Micromonospora TaxID=2617518 RepID=UPI00128D8C68|nr:MULTISPECIES: GNAT family N-acetyltransferase [unclassified Micromonospora]MDG4753782.1 GNAT family N-acetyltransferase [Micromonospora sp. WMMD718]